MISVHEFKTMKHMAKKISIITCYDYWSAKIIAKTNIDAILVGDSLAMVMHGHKSTIPATVDLMCMHINAVAKGADNKFIIGDLPFLSFRKDQASTMDAVLKVMQSGACAVKLEGAKGNLELISHIVSSGVPVMGHLGLTPQSVNQLGGFKIQGKDAVRACEIMQDALALQEAGCFSLVLECVPAKLAKEITQKLSIPTIGIGAGPEVSGQVLVLQDMLGMDSEFNPKFLKKYLAGFQLIHDALNSYDQEIKAGKFPLEDNCYLEGGDLESV